MISAQEFGEKLRQACFRQGTQRVFAERHGITGSMLSAIIHGKRKPTASILEELGYERVEIIGYRKKR